MPLTAEQIEKSRAEFEGWIVSEAARRNYAYMDVVLTRFSEDDSYATTWVDTAWMAWLARHETLCVELPIIECLSSSDKIFCSEIMSECIASIEAAGIAYK